MVMNFSSSAQLTYSDPTFQSYTSEEAVRFANARLSYPTELYRLILEFHSGASASTNLLLDVGCGPGISTRDFCHQFTHAIGVDPGHEMINTARIIGGMTRSGEIVRYEVCSAETLETIDGLTEGSVDVLTAAMAVSLQLNVSKLPTIL
jgi:predicted TPR repeat methyltransferase